MPAPQTFKNHTKLVPLFHGFVLPVLTANLLWAAYKLVTAPGGDTAMRLLMALALLVLAVYARTFALRVQDRVIRLEMRLRMGELLPAGLAGRLAEFTPGQLVAMRFASDAELPAIAAQALVHRASLVTMNGGDYADVPDLSLLTW
jgi:hypothetical protein